LGVPEPRVVRDEDWTAHLEREESRYHDGEARLGDAGRVRERKVALVREGLGRYDLHFSRTRKRVVVEGVFAFH